MVGKIPLVLVPGLLCSADLWQAQVGALGDLAEPQVTEEHARHDTMAGIATAILADAPTKFALAGLSLGGRVALEIMRQAPDRVLRLALIDTDARADTPEQVERRQALMKLARLGRFKGVTPRLLPLLIHHDRLDDAPLVERIMQMAEAVGRDAFFRQQSALISRIDSRPSLTAIHCPTLIVCGRQDQLTPLDRSEEMAALIAGSRLQVVEDCGHLSTMERPEAVNAAMRDWLAS